MMLALRIAERGSDVAWYWMALRNLTLLSLLAACMLEERRAARWATICCGGVANWLELTSGPP